jgi:hypothetical protein
MNTLKTAVIAILFGLVYGCSHPIEIVGEGDVLSASGTRNCYYEDFLACAENCSKNLVVHEYVETYYAVPRAGWEFDKWLNYCTNSNSDECAFNIPANVVKNSWGATVPPLVAVFTKTAPPPPEPVAMYSYALDAAGNLLNPQPLEGAQLQRRSVYFSFTGEYSKVRFWCCMVVDGGEEHMPAVTDDTAPFVMRVDTGALPDAGSLQRELYADLFDSNGDYTGHYAYWTLEPPISPIVFDDGNVHTIDYTIQRFIDVQVTNKTTLNLVAGADVYRIWVSGESELNVNAGKLSDIFANTMGRYAIHGGMVGGVVAYGSGLGTITGGSVGGISMEEGGLDILGGTIGSLNFGYGSVAIGGGTFKGSVNIIYPNSDLHIRGGAFSAPFSIVERSGTTFYGELSLTELTPNKYSVVGTLRDGTDLSQTITAYCVPSVDCSISVSP